MYDIKNKKIYFKTAQYRQVKSVAFSSFDFSCKAGSRLFNINQAMTGAIDTYMKPFVETINRDILQQAIEESKSRVEVNDTTKEAALAYVKSIKCK